MSRKTLLLILGLGVLALILIYVAVAPKGGQNPTSQTPTPTSFAHTVLKLSQATGDNSAINIVADTNGDNIIGVQFSLSYDPKVLSNVEILPGSFIPNPVVLQKTVDTTKGLISLAIAISPSGKPVTGTGTVATLTYTAQPTKTPTSISFVGKTLVAGIGHKDSFLSSRQGLIFVPR